MTTLLRTCLFLALLTAAFTLIIFLEYKEGKFFGYDEVKADIFGSTLIEYWTLDSSRISGTTVTDSSASANTGTITGTATVSLGKIGQSESFNGGTSYIRNATTVNTSAATLSAWVNIASYPAAGMTPLGFRLGNANSSYDKDIVVDSAGKVFFYYFSGAVKCTTLSANALSTGQWHLLTAVINSAAGGAIMYVDGKSVGTNATSGSFNTYAAGGNIMVGGVSGGTAATCGGGFAAETSHLTSGTKVDDVRVFNVALTANDVASLYNLGLAHHHGVF